ncbi:MAG: Asp-tRNA(Asn)/Glu-tRNA(Gln) amidotransferase subunit GatC [Nanobdellota archaeon]
MDVTQDLIRKVAAVARLNLTDEEVAEFTPQLKEVLDSFSALDEVDTEGLDPSYQPVDLRNVLRDDTRKESLSQEEATRNAQSRDGYILGPKAK